LSFVKRTHLPALLFAAVLPHLGCSPAATPPPAAPPPASASASAPTPRFTAFLRGELDRAAAEHAAAGALAVVLDARSGRIIAALGRAAGTDAPTVVNAARVTGSTLKPLTWAAALEAGVIAPDTLLDCAPRTYPTGTLTDSRTNGTLSVRDALAVSSNVAASRVLDVLGPARLRGTFERLHVFDAPGAAPPLPDETGIQAAMFAGGELGAATPLHLAAAYAALFSDGLYHAPTPDGSAPGVPALRPETASAVRELLFHTITSPLGTGGLAALPGHRVEGKTGTAVLEDGTSYASFVGAVVDVEPRWVVLVGLVAPREGATGKTAAAPLFARIAGQLVAEGC
jgi:cell division protein FtsI (penicillin-binding protein 3)